MEETILDEIQHLCVSSAANQVTGRRSVAASDLTGMVKAATTAAILNGNLISTEEPTDMSHIGRHSDMIPIATKTIAIHAGPRMIGIVDGNNHETNRGTVRLRSLANHGRLPTRIVGFFNGQRRLSRERCRLPWPLRRARTPSAQTRGLCFGR